MGQILSTDRSKWSPGTDLQIKDDTAKEQYLTQIKNVRPGAV